MKFLKKLFKKEDSYPSSNRLEELLKSAADNEAFRPDFYRQIFHFKLFVIGQMGQESAVKFLNNQIDGIEFAYAFTSLSALEYAIRKKNSEMPYLEMDSLQLFKILASAELGLILNADMDFGKVFNPNEIVDILNDEKGDVEQVVMESGAEIQIGIPTETPDHLIQVLNKFVLKNENIIKDIYFALKVEGEELNYIAAIDFQEYCDDKIEDVAKDISIIFSEVDCDQPVDMTIANNFYRQAYADGGMISCKTTKM